MGIIIDLLIIGIIVLSTLLAYKKGLAVLAIKLCAVILSLIVTLILYKPVSNLIINTTNIDETIQNAILEKSTEIIKTENKEDELFTSVLEQAKTGEIAETARDLSIQIINISVIIVLFFLIKIALRFVTVIANKVANLPIINRFNKAGGLIYGLVRGLVIVYLCLLLVGFVGKINKRNYLYESIETSSLGKMMFENNIFNVLL